MITNPAAWLLSGVILMGLGCLGAVSERSADNRGADNGDAVKQTSRPADLDIRSPSPDKEINMSEEKLAKVKLNAKAEIEGKSLVISYTVENSSDRDVYLWDGTFGWEGSTKVVDPNRVFIFFEEPDTVRVIRANLPLPNLRRITRKQILFGRLLKANSSLTGRTVLPQPTREHSPYYEPQKEEEYDMKKCSKIRLMIGWTPPKDGMKIVEKTINGEQWFSISGTWQQPYQEILEQHISLDTELLTYTTKFERQLPLR
jgi:hypothetical protein